MIVCDIVSIIPVKNMPQNFLKNSTREASIVCETHFDILMTRDNINISLVRGVELAMSEQNISICMQFLF